MKEQLTILLERFQHLSDYSDQKLGVLAAANSAIVIGLMSIITSQVCLIQIVFYYVIILNSFSLFFAISGLYAKRRNMHKSEAITEEKNYYYYKYVAQLYVGKLLIDLENDYGTTKKNDQKEKDLANQVIVLAKNADRKFKHFNIALQLTLTGILSPIALIIFRIYNKPESE